MTSHKEVSALKQDSTIEPLPYYPRLCRLLGGVTISIVLVYLEIHHSPPESDPAALPARAGLRNPPAMLDCDQACEDLGIGRRTLHTALESLGTWWRTEASRSAAARSGREFVHSGRSFPPSTYVKFKPYAFVGSRAFESIRTLAIHRNMSHIEQTLTDAGILQPNKYTDLGESCRSGHSVRGCAEVLGETLNLTPIPRGLAWGWSEERRKQASERMTAKWLKYRELASK